MVKTFLGGEVGASPLSIEATTREGPPCVPDAAKSARTYGLSSLILSREDRESGVPHRGLALGPALPLATPFPLDRDTLSSATLQPSDVGMAPRGAHG